ncbi:MAG TPA: hypothetical protein V6D17_01380 [Candidatus Obscuribacterales bacterium]
MSYDETERLRAKLAKLEEILEKQRWSQREQSVKNQETVESLRNKIDSLKRELEEYRFSEKYKMEEIAGYRKVFDSMAEAVYVIYETDEVVAFNAAARRLGRIKSLHAPLKKAKRGTVIDDLILKHTPEDEPEEVQLNVGIRPLRDGEGKIIGALAVCRKC